MPTNNNHILSEERLDQIFADLQQKADKTNLNPYDILIEQYKCEEHLKKDEQGNPKPGIEKHHILPKHAGGGNEASNLVLVTVEEHIIAHWVRYRTFNSPQDQRAVIFRIGDTPARLEARRAQVSEARERDRAEGRGFFNSEFQSEMGRRGGAIGGSQNTAEQFAARSRVGTEYGRITGMGNQSSELRDFLTKFSIWAHSIEAQGRRSRTAQSNMRGVETYYLVGPKAAFVDLVRTLNGFVPESIRKAESFVKVAKGERKQAYGWRLVNTLIRSEVEEGIMQFQEENPNIFLNFEESVLEILELE